LYCTRFFPKEVWEVVWAGRSVRPPVAKQKNRKRIVYNAVLVIAAQFLWKGGRRFQGKNGVFIPKDNALDWQNERVGEKILRAAALFRRYSVR